MHESKRNQKGRGGEICVAVRDKEDPACRREKKLSERGKSRPRKGEIELTAVTNSCFVDCC